MRWRTVILVLAALGVLLAAALLPELVAARQDREDLNQVMFENIEGIRLEFDQESALTIRQTISLVTNSSSTVNIPVELASRRQEKVETIARNMADRFFQAGILFQDPAEYILLYCYTELVYGPNNQNCIFWTIGLGPEDGSQSLSFFVDDRTGTVCSLEFHSARNLYGKDQMTLILDRFIRQYLTGLGEEFVDVDVSLLLKQAQMPQDGSYLATEMSWEEGYGRCDLTFFVNERGFYTYYSS